MPSIDEIKSVIGANLLGEVELRPPLHGAYRIDGQRAHRIARRKTREIRERGLAAKLSDAEVNEQINKFLSTYDVPKRPMRILKCDASILDSHRLRLDVVCGKGTYVRSIAETLAELL